MTVGRWSRRRKLNTADFANNNSLPTLSAHQKPKHIIEYAKNTRQAVLKYLAVLRWKTTVDLATTVSVANNGVPALGPAASLPTPHSNGESNNTSPTAYPVKGKGRLGGDAPVVEEIRGKVTDARRIQQFLEHQNAQHEIAIAHIRHVTQGVDTLRYELDYAAADLVAREMPTC